MSVNIFVQLLSRVFFYLKVLNPLLLLSSNKILTPIFTLVGLRGLSLCSRNFQSPGLFFFQSYKRVINQDNCPKYNPFLPGFS